jgi:hypothetical protein
LTGEREQNDERRKTDERRSRPWAFEEPQAKLNHPVQSPKQPTISHQAGHCLRLRRLSYSQRDVMRVEELGFRANHQIAKRSSCGPSNCARKGDCSEKGTFLFVESYRAERSSERAKREPARLSGATPSVRMDLSIGA